MRPAVFLAAIAALAAVGVTASGGGAGAATLVGLRADAPTSAPLALERAGATLAVPALHVWRLPAGSSTSVLRSLRGSVSFTEKERTYAIAAAPSDPLSDTEWWREDIRI